MSNLGFGLSALMEATKQTENAENKSNELVEDFEAAIDDDIIDSLTGEDSVESDMDGNGIGEGEDEEMAKLVDAIPPADKDIDSQIDDITESCLPIL